MPPHLSCSIPKSRVTDKRSHVNSLWGSQWVSQSSINSTGRHPASMHNQTCTPIYSGNKHSSPVQQPPSTNTNTFRLSKTDKSALQQHPQIWTDMFTKHWSTSINSSVCNKKTHTSLSLQQPKHNHDAQLDINTTKAGATFLITEFWFGWFQESRKCK